MSIELKFFISSSIHITRILSDNHFNYIRIKVLNIHQHPYKETALETLYIYTFSSRRLLSFRGSMSFVSITFAPSNPFQRRIAKKLNKFRRKRREKEEERKKDGLTKGMEATWFAPVSLHKDFSRLSISRRRVEKKIVTIFVDSGRIDRDGNRGEEEKGRGKERYMCDIHV